MATPSSGNSWKPNDAVSDQFPAGLRVLVVDDDSICLMILEAMLKKCLYEVTKCNRADIALKLLRDNKNGFDIVISDVYMPDIDGFKLLEEVGLDMDLPVIMMSADDSKDVVMKGVTHGACDYLIKPVRMEALKNIWQHVVRKKKHEWKDKDLEQSASVDDGERKQKALEDVDISSSATDSNGRRKRNDEEDDVDDRDDSGTLKKPRVVWSVELHQQFVAAVNQLGIDKAVPKKILELMNVPGLTRENVASHLQKYRLYLRRLSGVLQQQNGLGNSFMGAPDGSFGTMSSLHGFDFQALRSPGQIQAPGLIPFQSGALVRPSSRPPMSVPVVDQRNPFGFESPKLRYGEAEQQFGSNTDQMNLLHGIPTNMEPKQLASLNKSAQTLGGMNLQVNSQGSQNNPLVTQMTQPVSRAQILNKSSAGPVSTLSASVGQPIVLNGISSGGLEQGGSTNGICGTIYNPACEASSMVDFSLNGGSQLPGNGFPSRNSGISSLTSQGLIQGAVNINAKGPQGFVPSYEYLNELQQYKSLDWGLQNVGSTFGAYQSPIARGSMEVPPSAFVQPGFSSVQKTGHNRVGVPFFSSGEVSQNSNSNFGRPATPLVADSSPRVKIETLQDPNCAPNLFSQQYGQDDMLSAILKQQDSVGSVGTEFGFDGYQLDNLPA